MDISIDLGYLFFLIYKFFVSLLNFVLEPIANIFGFGEYYRGWNFLNTVLGTSPDSANRVGLFGEGLFKDGGYNLFGPGVDGSFFGNFFNNPFGGESFSDMIFGGWSGFFLFFAILFWILVWILKDFYIKPLEEKDEIIHDTVYEKEVKAEAASSKNTRWQTILDNIESEDPGRWKLAILDADVLLDELTIQQGLRGDTLGERLKDAQDSDFQTLQSAWKAHLERNRIAHGGSSYSISKREAKRIIALYGQVFSEFYH